MIFERSYPNGVDLVVKSVAVPVVSVQIWVDVGSLDEKPEEAGFCHFLEHMLFKGTKARSTSEIAGAIEGAGGDMNAFTSFEYTAYHVTLPRDRWRLAWDILFDMVTASAFFPQEFKPEKEVILEEIKRGEDSPDRKLYQGLYTDFWGNKGYGLPVIGYPRTIKKSTDKGLKAFWQKWYRPEFMTVVVTGDVSAQEVEAAMSKSWALFKPKPSAQKASRQVRRRMTTQKFTWAKPKGRPITEEFPIKSVRWAGGVPAVNLFHDDVPALDVAALILGQGDASRLYQRLFRDEQLVTSIGCSLWSPWADGVWLFDADLSTEQADGTRFRKTLLNELKKFIAEGPTAEELDRAKVSLESDRIYGSQSMESLAHRFGYLKTSMGFLGFDLEYLESVRSLTAEDVREIARKYLVVNEFAERALVPKGFSKQTLWKETEQALLHVGVESNSEKRKTPPVKKVSKKPTIEKDNIQSAVLKNGIELVTVVRNEVPVVSMMASCIGGLRVETKSTAGIGSLLADVWEKGPSKMTPQEFTRKLESVAASISAFSGRNSIGLSGTMLTKYFPDVSSLFIDTLAMPGFDAKELEQSRLLQLEDLRTLEDNPGRYVERVFCEELFKNHSYGLPPSGFESGVSSFSREDLLRHYGSYISDQRLVVTCVGKFSSQSLAKKLEEIDWKKTPIRTEKPAKVLAGTFQDEKTPIYREIHKGREQSHIMLGYKGLALNDPDRYVFKVLLNLLSGQSGRLFTELRDKQGLCYVVAPVAFEGIDPGYFGVYMGCDPAKRTVALEGIRKQLERLCSSGIAASEVNRAKEYLLGKHEMDLQLNGHLASTLNLNKLYGLGEREHLTWAQEFKSVTPERMKKLARRLISGREVCVVIV